MLIRRANVFAANGPARKARFLGVASFIATVQIKTGQVVDESVSSSSKSATIELRLLGRGPSLFFDLFVDPVLQVFTDLLGGELAVPVVVTLMKGHPVDVMRVEATFEDVAPNSTEDSRMHFFDERFGGL